MDLTAYICQKAWSPVGLDVVSARRDMDVKKEDNNFELTAFLCPSGYSCNGNDVTAFLLQEGYDEIKCYLCEDDKISSDDLDWLRQELLNRHNEVRATHPDECPNPENLKLNDDINAVAQWMAEDMASNDYLNHIDRFGRTPAQRASDAGINWTAYGENIHLIIHSDPISAEEIVQDAMDGWMNSPPHRHNIMTPQFNQVGFGIATGEGDVDGVKVSKTYIVANFAVLSSGSEGGEITYGLPTLPCTIDCVQRIRWEQSYSVVNYWDGDEYKTKKVPGDLLRFKAKLSTLCVLEKASLEFEVSPCKWELIPNSLHESIPEDGTLKLVWTDKPAGAHNTFIDSEGNLVAEFSISEACFIPGEWVALYVWIRGFEDCSPITWAVGWFETKCFTSGLIQGCGLLEGNNVIEGGYLQNLKYSWVGDDRLHWLVLFKGDLVWLKSSDWTKYNIGQRCFIYKNGVGVFKSAEGVIEQIPGCRWPVSATDPQNETILSDANVSYKLDRSKDIIVPFEFLGIGA